MLMAQRGPNSRPRRTWFRIETAIAMMADLKPDECWIWPKKPGPHGYGIVYYDGKQRRAHRVAYEILVGPIPDGLEPDHLCRNRACFNPRHLEIVTHEVNSLRGDGIPARNARKTHCEHGHPFDESNTRYLKRRRRNGTTSIMRVCRACVLIDTWIRRGKLSPMHRDLPLAEVRARAGPAPY